MKKNAQLTGEIVSWLVKILLTVLILAAIYAVVNFSITEDFNVSSTIADLMIRRTYYSSSCFALKDTSVEPGVIDLNKFNELRLKNCLNTEYPVKLSLEKLNRTISNTKFYDEEYNLCQIQNKKKRCFFDNKQYVLTESNGFRDFDMLNIGVIIR